MRIMFIGQAPSKETDGKPPFVGKCGKFLAELLGTTQEEMLVAHDFKNVLNSWPGKGLGGDLFPISQARIAAREMLESIRARTVVLLGHNVARAFGAKQFQYLQWYEYRHPDNVHDVVISKLTVIPHPSGVNRIYNIQSNREAVARFLRNLATT